MRDAKAASSGRNLSQACRRDVAPAYQIVVAKQVSILLVAGIKAGVVCNLVQAQVDKRRVLVPRRVVTRSGMRGLKVIVTKGIVSCKIAVIRLTGKDKKVV